MQQNSLNDPSQANVDHDQIIAEHAPKVASTQEMLPSKEQEWAAREREWATRENEWMSREQEWAFRDGERASREQLLQSSIESQSAQIAALNNSLDAMKAEEQDLRTTCARLEAQLVNSQAEAADKLSQLELELEGLRQAHESDQNHIQTFGQVKQELEEKLHNQDCQLSGYKGLQVEHDALAAKYTECLSQLRDLEFAKCSLEEKMRSGEVDLKAELDQLKSSCRDETEKQVEKEKHYVELENKYSVDIDALNNKINELQSIVQKSEAAIQDATDATDAERHAVTELQKTLQEKNDLLGIQDLKQEQLEERLNILQTENLEMQEALNSKEEIVTRLTQQCQTSQDALVQKEKESCSYAEQIVALQDEAIAAKHVHGVEQSECNYRSKQLDEQMEEMHSEYQSLQTKLREAEGELSVQKDNKSEILSNLQKLEGELEKNREEKDQILQIIHSLNSNLEAFQEQKESSLIPTHTTSEWGPTAEAKNKLSEKSHKECDMLVSKFDNLMKELENQKLKFEGAEAMVSDLTEKLKQSEENLLSAQTELANIQEDHSNSIREAEIQLASLDIRAREAEQLQTEVTALKGLEQQLVERDRCQEELQSQLENTVSQWQRLQRIVQEKEVDLQQSQEALEEQRRICSTLRKTFDEEKQQLESEASQLQAALQHEKEQRNISDCDVWDLRGKVQILEGELEVLTENKCSHLAVLSDSVATLQRELSDVKDRSKTREAEILEAQQSIEEKVGNLTLSIAEKNIEIEELTNKTLSKEEVIKGLENELCHLKDENVELKDQVSHLNESLSTFESELNQIHFAVDKKDLEIKDLNSSNQSQKEKAEHLEAELDDLRKVCGEIFTSANLEVSGADGLQALFNKKDSDLASLQNAVTQLEEDLTAERCNSKQAIEAVQSRVEETEATLESTLIEKGSIEKELLLMKQQACEVETSHELLQAAHSDIQLKLGDNEKTLQSVAQENESLSAQLAQMKQDVCEEESKHDLLQTAYLELQAKLSDAETRLQSTAARKCELETELEQVKCQLSDAETLQTACSEMQSKLDVVEQALQTSTNDKEVIELELNQIKGKHDNLNAAHSELKERFENKEEALEAAMAQTMNLEKELVQIKKQLSEVETSNEIFQNSSIELQEKLTYTEESLGAISKDKESLEKEIGETKQKLSEMQDKCQHIQATSLEIQVDSDEKDKANEKLRQVLIEKENAISQLEREKESLKNHVMEVTSSFQTSQSSENSLKDAYDNLKMSDEEKANQIDELERKVTYLDHEVERLEGVTSNLSSELQHRDEALVEQAVEITKITEEIERKDVSLEEEKERFKSLEQQTEIFASEKDLHMKENIEKQVIMKAQLEEIENLLTVKEEQLLSLDDQRNEEKYSHEGTQRKLKNLEMELCRVHGELSHLIGCAQEREAYLVEQTLLSEGKDSELVAVMDKLERGDTALKELNEKHETLKEDHNEALSQVKLLQSDKESLKADLSRLQADLDNQETTNTQYEVECKQLNERLTQMGQALETKDGTVFDLNHDIDMFKKEIGDLRTEVVQKDTSIADLQEKLSSAKVAAERKNEEAEMLKSNFDSCIEDMQIKLTEQEAKTKRLQSQLAEEARNVHQGKDDLKEMFELQISQMEDKIIKSEQQNEQLEKDLEDERSKAASSKDMYEHQLAELELNLQASNSDLIRVKDELSKVTSNHECSVAGLKRLHEIQTSELEDNCMTLEKTVAEQKRQINDMQSKFHKEKMSLEQNFEIQISDMEEKRRLTEHEVDRFKRHLEEMKSDHAREMRQLEKSYESRLFELEDKCCVATSERDRLRASLADQSGMGDGNLLALETKLQEVEVTRRDLDLKNLALEDEVLSLKESARQREEEMMAVLKDAADRHRTDTSGLNDEVGRLNEKLFEHTKRADELKSNYEEKIQDLEMNNNQLKEKVRALEMHVEHDQELRDGERTSDFSAERAELQNTISSLSAENNTLKCEIFMQRRKERNEHLSSGVEEICPPYASGFSQKDCFSTTQVNPVVEGFVAEHSKQCKALPLGINRTNSGEPDFVEEQAEGFQPEIEDQQVVSVIHPLNVHPIQESVVNEGFQPEVSDVFVMEEPDGIQQNKWPLNLSVGMSPSHHYSNQFDFNIPETGSQSDQSPTSLDKENLMTKDCFQNTEHPIETCDESQLPSGVAKMESSEEKEFTMADLEKKIQAVQDELEEKYVGKLRKQEVDLTHDFATKQENYQKEMEQSYAQRIQAVKYEWERKFTKALQKVRREMEKRHQMDLSSLRKGTSPSLSAGTSPRADRTEGQDDLGETVEQLHKENQVSFRSWFVIKPYDLFTYK